MKLPVYKLTKKEPCPLCQGKGVRYNLIWKNYIDGLKNGTMTEDIGTYFRRHGFMNVLVTEWPEIASACRECNGFGIREISVDLVKAIEDLKNNGEIK